MGQEDKGQRPPITRRVLPAALFLATLILLITALSSGTLGEGEYRNDGTWGSLELASGVAQPIPVTTDSVTFSMYVHWDGPYKDAGVIMRVEPIPEGWDYSVVDATPTTRGFHVDDEGTVEVELEVGIGTEPGTYYMEPNLEHPFDQITLTSFPILVKVLPIGLDLDVVDGPKGVIHPGLRIRGEVLVTSDAAIDRIIEVVVTFTPEDWVAAPTWRTSLLRQGSAEPVAFAITVPDQVLPGEYSVLFETRSLDPRIIEAETSLTMMLDRVQGMRLTDDLLMLDGVIGGTASVDVWVENTGNVHTNLIDVVPLGTEALPGGWDVTTDGLPMIVEPYSTGWFNLSLSLPEDAPLAPSGKWDIPLRMLTGQAITDTDLDILVMVPESRDIHIDIPQMMEYGTGEGPDEAEPYQRTLDLVLRDAGNLPGVRWVHLTVEHGGHITRAALAPDTLLLTSGMEVMVTLDITLHPDTKAGNYTIVLRAYDDVGAGAEAQIILALSGADVGMVGGLSVEPLGETSFYTDADATVYRVVGKVHNKGDEDLSYAIVEMYEATDSEYMFLGYVPIEDLTAGEDRDFLFTYSTTETSDAVVIAQLSVPGTPISDPNVTAVESRVEAVPMEPAIPDSLPFVIVLGFAVGTMAGIIAILGTEAGRFALLAFVLIPLYTRLKPHQVTDHFVRGQILGYVKANPGETYTHIRKALKLKNGTFVYHARILESQGYIKSVKDGANRRFYPAEMRIPTEVKDVELNQVQRMIYTIVMEYPGISQTRIAKMMELAPSTVNYHVNIMTKVGVIERRRSGRLSLCFATEDAE
jgi:predicted transcriptional regulator